MTAARELRHMGGGGAEDRTAGTTSPLHSHGCNRSWIIMYSSYNKIMIGYTLWRLLVINKWKLVDAALTFRFRDTTSSALSVCILSPWDEHTVGLYSVKESVIRCCYGCIPLLRVNYAFTHQRALSSGQQPCGRGKFVCPILSLWKVAGRGRRRKRARRRRRGCELMGLSKDWETRLWSRAGSGFPSWTVQAGLMWTSQKQLFIRSNETSTRFVSDLGRDAARRRDRCRLRAQRTDNTERRPQQKRRGEKCSSTDTRRQRLFDLQRHVWLWPHL